MVLSSGLKGPGAPTNTDSNSVKLGGGFERFIKNELDKQKQNCYKESKLMANQYMKAWEKFQVLLEGTLSSFSFFMCKTLGIIMKSFMRLIGKLISLWHTSRKDVWFRSWVAFGEKWSVWEVPNIFQLVSFGCRDPRGPWMATLRKLNPEELIQGANQRQILPHINPLRWSLLSWAIWGHPGLNNLGYYPGDEERKHLPSKTKQTD